MNSIEWLTKLQLTEGFSHERKTPRLSQKLSLAELKVIQISFVWFLSMWWCLGSIFHTNRLKYIKYISDFETWERKNGEGYSSVMSATMYVTWPTSHWIASGFILLRKIAKRKLTKMTLVEGIPRELGHENLMKIGGSVMKLSYAGTTPWLLSWTKWQSKFQFTKLCITSAVIQKKGLNIFYCSTERKITTNDEWF